MNYQVTLKIGKQEYKAEAETLEEAIVAVKPPVIKANGILSVQYGEKKSSYYLTVISMRRLFSNNQIFRIVLSKNLKLLLK